MLVSPPPRRELSSRVLVLVALATLATGGESIDEMVQRCVDDVSAASHGAGVGAALRARVTHDAAIDARRERDAAVTSLCAARAWRARAERRRLRAAAPRVEPRNNSAADAAPDRKALDIISVMKFDDAGKVTSMRAFWSFDAMRPATAED